MVSSVVLIASDGTRHSVSSPFTVGRLPESGLFIDDTRVSRTHAEIVLSDQGVVLEDKGSSNGTKVNGVSATGPVVLQHGDSVSFDAFVYLVEFDGRAIGGAEASDGDVTEVRIPAEEVVTSNVPRAWTEDDDSANTVFLRPDDIPDTFDPKNVERLVPGAHIIILAGSASPEGVELSLSNAAEQDVWELGRGESCDIAIDDEGMSQRHAQLIHKSGTWKMVNLVSTNGIVVNGEKRLSVFLNDGDVVQLGKTKVVFYGPEGAQRKAPSGPAKQDQSVSGESRPAWLIPAVVGGVVAALVLGALALDLF